MELTNEMARFETRISKVLHQRIQRIAKLQHRSATDFATTALQEAVLRAEKELEQQEVMVLSAKDQERFAQALLNPKEPNEALKRAFKYHKKMVKNG